MIGSDEIIGFDTQNYIFMIGLGWEDPDTGKWQYQDFTVNKVTLEEESKIISDMWKLVDSLMTKYQITTLPNFYHWSHAEPTCYSKAIKRHNFKFKAIILLTFLKFLNLNQLLLKVI